MELGVLDAGVTPGRLASALRRVQPRIVVLALPIDPLLDLLPTVASTDGPPDRLVIDISSVKGPIVAAAAQCRGFVGGHPMAGRERGGIDQASDALFRDRTFALCRAASTTDADLRRARALVRGLGAVPLQMDAAAHDRCVALTSHLPHVLAIALMEQAAALDDELPRGVTPWSMAAGAWRDATRVARADPAMWNAILAHNREAVSETLEQLLDQLSRLRDALREGAPDPLTPDAGGLDARAAARNRARIDAHLPKSAPPPLRAPSHIGHDQKRLGRRRR